MPHSRPRIAAILPLVLIAALACTNEPTASSRTADAPPSTPAPPPPEVKIADVIARLHHGIDVSEHSGQVEWPKLIEEGHSFAFVKATEGVDLKDPVFDEHWRAMKAAGVIRGAYHFFVSEDDAAEQARFFIANVTLEPGDLAPMVDVELVGHHTGTGLPERLAVWLALVEEHYGVKPIIYTTAKFWDEHFDDSFGSHPLWVAEYDTEAPRLPVGWKTWHLWQFKGDATVAGVEKGADLSKINRDQPEIDLSALIVPPPTSGG